MNEERTLEVEIEPGVRDGMEYPFIGEGTSFNFYSLTFYILLEVLIYVRYEKLQIDENKLSLEIWTLLYKYTWNILCL